MPALVVKCPSRLILALMAARSAFTRLVDHAALEFSECARHLKEQLASCRVEVLLVQLEVDANGLEVLDRAQ